MCLVAVLDVPRFGPLSLVASFSFSFPDLDLKTMIKSPLNKREESKHRHWFWHSSILVFCVFLLGAYAMEFEGISIFCVEIGTHLLCDWKPGKDGKRGTYLIYLRRGNRMSRNSTDRYLIANSMICYLLGVLGLLL